MVLPAFLIAVTLSGCVGAGASAGTPTAAPSRAPLSASATPCPGIDLRTPKGSRIDLSGAWEGETGFYQVTQHGSCVWFVAQQAPNDVGSTDWLLAFHGQVTPDFNLRGEWAFVYIAHLADRPTGEITYHIDVDLTANEETVTLRQLSQTEPPHSPTSNFPRIAQLLHRVT